MLSPKITMQLLSAASFWTDNRFVEIKGTWRMCFKWRGREGVERIPGPVLTTGNVCLFPTVTLFGPSYELWRDKWEISGVPWFNQVPRRVRLWVRSSKQCLRILERWWSWLLLIRGIQPMVAGQCGVTLLTVDLTDKLRFLIPWEC